MMQMLLVFGMIVGWGLWGFFSKLSDKKIGQQVAFWDALVLLVILTVYLLFSHQFFPVKWNSAGILWGVLAGVGAGVASIFFFMLLSKHPAGYLVTLSALYPIVTIILSVIFLHEQITPLKGLGIALALIAIMLMNWN